MAVSPGSEQSGEGFQSRLVLVPSLSLSLSSVLQQKEVGEGKERKLGFHIFLLWIA